MTRNRSMRGGIYEPYRQHFPLKNSQLNFQAQMTTTSSANQAVAAAAAQYGPKLISRDGGNQQQQQLGLRRNHGALYGSQLSLQQPNQYESHQLPNQQYETHQPRGLARTASDANYSTYRPTSSNYQPFSLTGQNGPGGNLQGQNLPGQTSRYGSNASINKLGTYTDYEQHHIAQQVQLRKQRQPTCRSNSLNFGTSSSYEQFYPQQRKYEMHQLRGGPNNPMTGSMTSLTSFPNGPYQTGSASNFNMLGQGRPRRPNSAMLPMRSASNAESFLNPMRPPRPSSAQGSLQNLDQISNANYETQSLLGQPISQSLNAQTAQMARNAKVARNASFCTSGVSDHQAAQSAAAQSSSYTLHQLRQSQTNLQTALRMHQTLQMCCA
jgi:hypothetical protein